MNYTFGRGIRWLGIYFLLALIPLGIGRVGRIPEARGFAVELGVGLGFLALAVFALQFVFSGRIKQVAPRFGMDNIIQYHREMGLIALLLVLAHPVVLIAADSSFLAYFDPRVNALRAIFLIVAMVSAVALVATSLWRAVFRLEYEWWRAIHGALALVIVGVGAAHTYQVGHYTAAPWKRAALGLLLAASVYPLAHTRLVRPWLNRRRRYEVVEVEPERDSSWSMTLEARNGQRMRFVPGQFVWITVGETPFSLQQHPFSIASSRHDPRIRLTAKEFGDFTSRWKTIDAGTSAYLEGPFGSFTPDPSPDVGIFLVMGGIGITPAMSMLRTLRDEGSRRPVTLIYGNKDWENVTFREELDELALELDMELVHLLEEPPADWEGETGFVTRELLEKYLPQAPDRYQYFICGPKPLMDVAEVSLRDLGIGWQRIYTERFEIV